MHIKTYRAASMPEALQMIRDELGSEAALVSSRSIWLGGWTGRMAGRRGVEVTASASIVDTMRTRRRLLDQGIDLSNQQPVEPSSRLHAPPGQAWSHDSTGAKVG
jgi:flagellar biosynthesis protein FlhF